MQFVSFVSARVVTQRFSLTNDPNNSCGVDYVK